ncbi:HIT family protein [hydrothermal vent metagenome]|uniref:HIT family protein n=1 Tax=hydrothermal vent metagenome TaxID=652676 RepID=A0A3B1AMA4_9ZZZZ
MHRGCPFCEIVNNDPLHRIVAQNELAFIVRDGFPVSEGHTLIIPKRHVASFFEITSEERESLFALLDSEKKVLDKELNPDAYNIGINDGVAAGQTVSHLHIHLIPRFRGDVDDPRGGIRWIKPEKAVYWSEDT